MSTGQPPRETSSIPADPNPYQAPASSLVAAPEGFSPIPFAGRLTPEFLAQVLGQRRRGALAIVVLAMVLICSVPILTRDQSALIVTLVALVIGALVVRLRLQPATFREIKYEGLVREDGIEIHTDHVRSHSDWAAFRRTREMNDAVLLFPDSPNFVLLHHSFFQDEGDWQTARQAALSRIDASQPLPPVPRLAVRPEETSAVPLSGTLRAGIRRRLDFQLFRVLRALLLGGALALLVALPLTGPWALVLGISFLVMLLVVLFLVFPRWRAIGHKPLAGIISDAGVRLASSGSEAMIDWAAFTGWQVLRVGGSEVLLLEMATGARQAFPRDLFAEEAAWHRAAELCDLHLSAAGGAATPAALPARWWLTPLTLLAVAGALTAWEIEKALARGPLTLGVLAGAAVPLLLMLLLSWWMLPTRVRRRLFGRQ